MNVLNKMALYVIQLQNALIYLDHTYVSAELVIQVKNTFLKNIRFKFCILGDGYHCNPIEARPCTRSEWMASDCGRNHVCLVWPNNLGNGAVVDCERCKHGFRQRNGVCSGI